MQRAGGLWHHQNQLVERISRVVSMVENDRMAIMLVDTAFLKAASVRFCFREQLPMVVSDACMRQCVVEYLLKCRDENRIS